MEHFIYDKGGNGLSHEEIKEALLVSLEGRELKNVLRNAQKHDKILVIIGPEGGFENEEIEFFKENNFECVSISNLIFRAETAAINAISGVIYEYEL